MEVTMTCGSVCVCVCVCVWEYMVIYAAFDPAARASTVCMCVCVRVCMCVWERPKQAWLNWSIVGWHDNHNWRAGWWIWAITATVWTSYQCRATLTAQAVLSGWILHHSYKVHAAEHRHTCSLTCRHTHTNKSLIHDDVHFLQDVLCRNPSQLGISSDSLIIQCIQFIWTGPQDVSQLCHQFVKQVYDSHSYRRVLNEHMRWVPNHSNITTKV